MTSELHNRIQSLRRGGQPLDATTRAYMEPRFGHDFSQVRIHTDERAAETARSVNALAYTMGRDVVFGAGRYEPGTSEGRKLLAHELTHTIQQQIENNATISSQNITHHGSSLESEAEKNATRLTTTSNISPFLFSKIRPIILPQIQRYESYEHVLLGGEKDKQKKITIQGIELNYGEFIAMGDYFRTPDDIFNANPNELRDLVDLIRKQTVKPSSVTDKDWQRVTKGRYLELAQMNIAHFAPPNPALVISGATSTGNQKSIWEGYHRRAIDAARTGEKDKALAINGFADHFLTDAFATGHLVNKEDIMEKFKQNIGKSSGRFFDKVAEGAWAYSQVSTLVSQYKSTKVLHFGASINDAKRFSKLLQGIHEARPDVLSNAIAAAIHNVLNTKGGNIEVENKKGDKWMLSGEGTLSASSNAKTMEIARKAVAQSQQDILNATNMQGQVDYEPFFKNVWDYVPFPSSNKGSKDVQALIAQLTDPNQQLTTQVVIEMLVDKIAIIMSEVERQGFLKKTQPATPPPRKNQPTVPR